MPKIYIFNPEHDLALANGNANFKAPESAVSLANDLSLLPCWYAEPGSYVLSDLNFANGELPFALPVEVMPTYMQQQLNVSSAEPWGWDLAVRKFLLKNGVEQTQLPTDQNIENIKKLSHRRIASEAMEFLRGRLPEIEELPSTAMEFTSYEEIADFAAHHKNIVLKAPWSGSGKGIFFSEGELTASISGWCQRVLERQGSVMGEIVYERVQDFAMEFLISKGTVTFAGYSLFRTEGRGIYRGNRLMSNEAIIGILTQWVASKKLEQIKELLINFISDRFAHDYNGYIGVDMFIYRTDNGFNINPAVEINTRMTMGMVARIIADRYVAEGSQGWFMIDHQPPEYILLDHRKRMASTPMQVENGKFVKGYLSLCPVSENTIYRATVIINN